MEIREGDEGIYDRECCESLYKIATSIVLYSFYLLVEQNFTNLADVFQVHKSAQNSEKLLISALIKNSQF